MSYSSRRRYKSRREKAMQTWRNFKIVALFLSLLMAIFLFRNWIDIRDYLLTYF